MIVASILLDELIKFDDIKEPELDEEIKNKLSEYRSSLRINNLLN